jgi:hypothetical protein
MLKTKVNKPPRPGRIKKYRPPKKRGNGNMFF